MSYWYIEHEDDNARHFCFAKVPSYVCTYADGDDLGRLEGLAAEERGITKLAEIVRNAHRRGASIDGPRDRVNGKLTENCRVCGAKLKRLGFAAWEERERQGDGAEQRVAARLGLSPPAEVIGQKRYFRTKAKARAWAVKHAEPSKAAA